MNSNELNDTTIAAPVALTPGFHKMSHGDYHRLDAVSNSRLSELLKSPAHLRYRLDNPKQDTDATAFGSAFHTSLLEPEVFEATYVVMPKFDRRTKEGKAGHEAFTLMNDGKTFLDADDREHCLRMADKIRKHPFAGAICGKIADRELVGMWLDPVSGLLCKMKIDGLAPAIKTVVDIKTTKDARRREFEKSIFTYGYYRQAAMYLGGLEILGRKFDSFVNIAIEKEAPYELAVYRVKDDVVQLGRKQLASLMRLYKQCVTAQVWPGYPEEVQEIGISDWNQKLIEEACHE